MGNGKSKNRLRVRRVVDVPLREVSGICLRRGRNGQMFLIAVGDRVAKIAWFSQPRSDGGRIDWHTSNIAKLSGSMLPERDSQIEAVCADGLGRVLLLQETPPRVELIDPKALKVVASIDLAVEGRSEIAQAWSDPKGSRGDASAPPRTKPRDRECGGPNSMKAAGFFSLATSKCPPGSSTAP
jgi:hypothetical protein